MAPAADHMEFLYLFFLDAADSLKNMTLDSQSKTTSELINKNSANANEEDVDLVKPQPQRRRKRKQHRLYWKQNRKLNLKLLDEYPNSFFMDVRCRGCFFVSTIHSHLEEPQHCPMCHMVLYKPSKTPGDRGTLTHKCTFWRQTNKIFSGFVYGPVLPN
ncbi:40S ribosomal protein S27 [Orobanche hederae]